MYEDGNLAANKLLQKYKTQVYKNQVHSFLFN